jgi:exoribonuclease-2
VTSVFKEIPGGVLVRAEELPLVLPVLGVSGLPRGARLRVKLGAVDEITLDVAGTLLERLDLLDAAADAALSQDQDGEDDDAPAGPIAIVMDTSEADANTEAAVVAVAP